MTMAMTVLRLSAMGVYTHRRNLLLGARRFRAIGEHALAHEYRCRARAQKHSTVKQ